MTRTPGRGGDGLPVDPQSLRLQPRNTGPKKSRVWESAGELAAAKETLRCVRRRSAPGTAGTGWVPRSERGPRRAAGVTGARASAPPGLAVPARSRVEAPAAILGTVLEAAASARLGALPLSAAAVALTVKTRAVLTVPAIRSPVSRAASPLAITAPV